MEKSDHRQLLRPCRQRPRRRRGAEEGEEGTAVHGCPHHSITSSAKASSGSGMVKLSVLAVLRLMMKSNLVGCCTGRSWGFSPLRIRPEYTPNWRNILVRLA